MRVVKSVPASVGFVGMLLAASAVEAQTAPAPNPPAAKPAPKTEGTTVSGVTVKADEPPVKTSIDRRSYSVSGDLQATSGSIADALKRIPSVEVDIDGNVKLRGDSSVTILIDGKPSGVMKGPGRADALSQLPADQIDRVEVLTNPGADFSPEGTGGVINLVTKKASRSGAGVSGSVRGNINTSGRTNGGLNWAYNNRKLSLSANAGFWTFDTRFDTVDDRTLGGAFRRRSVNTATLTGAGGNLRLAADYALDARNRISGELNVFAYGPSFETRSRYENYDVLGVLTGLTGRRGESDNRSSSGDASLSWRREFTGQDHNLTLQLNRDRWVSDNDSLYRLFSVTPAGVDSFEGTDSHSVSDDLSLKGDYNRPMPGESRLKAGFELQRSKVDNDNVFSVGPSKPGLVFDPARSHRLIFDEKVGSAYLTYERPFGDLTLLAGLRYETASNDLDLVTTGLKTSHGYDRFYPSLHLDYRLSDTSRLKASYSLRIMRPGAGDLDPFRTYSDAFNYRQGNPNLEPSETRSWEASYEYRKDRSYYLVTAFWRQTDNGITDQLVDLGGGVLLTTKANLAQNSSGGLEFVVNRALTKTLSVNLTGTGFYNQIDAGAFSLGRDRSAWSVSGRASFDWQASPNDLVQVNAVANGGWITPQGRIEPTYQVNLGYRRKLNERWFLTLTATDIFDSMDGRTVLDAPGLTGFSTRDVSSRGVGIGLRYRFGAGKPQRDPAFDYGGGGGGPG
ncbi:outer membrane receptor protein involved in Fe transport [Caulobacter ginsengisoli]|uniref:Outer membrane receptor protein involved in Fe transport n=1 Tax=Caulobacter ginsengisoli TaxID=400775 RepID=A0ABU0IUE7_9CAUL|nr:TonB-dependent receptor [Caulobacter ginsengisoli]MDQ0465636.1 outer membrane receptor protein involved in Fe transport [Caulobacter ginsengisoli]